MIFIGIIFSVLTSIHAEESKVDFSERIEFSQDQYNLITFQYCNRDACEKLHQNKIPVNKLAEAGWAPKIKSIAARQIFVDAGTNTKMGSGSRFGVAIVEGSGKAICSDRKLKDLFSVAQSKGEYLLSVKNIGCTGAPDDNTPLRESADELKVELSKDFYKSKTIPEKSFPGINSDDPGEVVGECKTQKSPKKFVFIFQQWHLPPNEKTEITTGKYPEQEENQTATYDILAKWIERKAIEVIIAEGCEGEITSAFRTEFNGWDYSRFKKEVNNPLYNRITAHVPLKLEVKYGDKVKTLCGDNNKLIEAGNLYFSDIRGFGGFLARIQQLKDPNQQKSYLKLATDILKISENTKTEVVLAKLKEAIKSRVAQIKKSLAERNDAFVKKILSSSDHELAVVIGGAHVEDLRIKLEKSNIGCQIIKPKGYNFDPKGMFIAIESMF